MLRERSTSDPAWIADIRSLWARSELVEPPTWLRERAKQLGRALTAPESRSNVLSRVRAALVFDSRGAVGHAPSGVRSGAVSGGTRQGSWQLLYRGGDVDVDMLVRPNQDGHTANVRGQALSLVGASLGTGVVEAKPADEPPPLDGDAVVGARSEVEPSGEFALPNLERGRYDMLLRLGSREIELSGVEL